MGIQNAYRRRQGFTIVELIVVIAVIAILAAIIIFSVGAWQDSVRKTAVKSDLNAASSAMESARNFATSYPLTIPATFSPSANISIVLTVGTTSQYCIDGQSSQNTAIQYYIYSKTKDKGPLEGTCATRPDLEPPAAPASVVVATTTGTTANVTWPSVADAVSYIAQCASDPVFIYGPQQTTTAQVSGTVSATVTGLTPSSTFYCRVKSINAKGTSAWSSSNGSTTTNLTYGSLAVATSIEGYWTSAPQGFLLEDGSAVSRTAYAALFAIIGTTYGVGDGTTTFNLPDSRGRASVNQDTTSVEFAAIGQKTGSKTETLTLAQLPSHQHTVQNPRYTTATSHTHQAMGNTTTEGPNPAGGTAGDIWTTSTGGDGSHNNIQPSIVKISAIKYLLIDTSAQKLPAGTSIAGYWSSAPTDYLLEDGAAVSRTTYSDLFTAVGTQYGAGNGSTTFNLPNSQGKATVNISGSDAEFDTMGEIYGENTHILTIAEMPAHSHSMANPRFTTVAHTHSSAGGTAAEGPNPSSGVGGDIYTNPAGGGLAHNEIQPSITKKYAVKFTAATGSGGDVSVGTSVSGYWSTIPTGYLFEDGAAVSRTTYADLFSLIGTTFGVGNGTTTFNIPDSRGRLAVNLSSTDSEFDVLGEKFGTKTVTLTVAQIPSHVHSMQNPRYGTTASHSHSAMAGTIAEGPNPASGVASDIGLNNTGGGGAHNNLQPSIVKRTVIKY